MYFSIIFYLQFSAQISSELDGDVSSLFAPFLNRIGIKETPEQITVEINESEKFLFQTK